MLPAFKDLNQKFSLWSFMSNSVGKDLSEITAPVHFNEPLSMTHKTALNVEYADILEKAMQFKGDENAEKRLAYVAVYSISMNTAIEKDA